MLAGLPRELLAALHQPCHGAVDGLHLYRGPYDDRYAVIDILSAELTERCAGEVDGGQPGICRQFIGYALCGNAVIRRRAGRRPALVPAGVGAVIDLRTGLESVYVVTRAGAGQHSVDSLDDYGRVAAVCELGVRRADVVLVRVLAHQHAVVIVDPRFAGLREKYVNEIIQLYLNSGIAQSHHRRDRLTAAGVLFTLSYVRHVDHAGFGADCRLLGLGPRSISTGRRICAADCKSDQQAEKQYGNYYNIPLFHITLPKTCSKKCQPRCYQG